MRLPYGEGTGQTSRGGSVGWFVFRGSWFVGKIVWLEGGFDWRFTPLLFGLNAQKASRPLGELREPYYRRAGTKALKDGVARGFLSFTENGSWTTDDLTRVLLEVKVRGQGQNDGVFPDFGTFEEAACE